MSPTPGPSAPTALAATICEAHPASSSSMLPSLAPVPTSSVPGPSKTRRSTRICHPSTAPQPVPLLPTKKKRGRKRHVYEWLVEDGNSDSDGVAQPELDDDENTYDKQAPEPHIVTVMSKLDLRLVCLPRRGRPGYPHRFLACSSCEKGLEPQDAVTHAAGAKTQGGHNINISLADRRALREWIKNASDLHSAQNMPPLPNQHGNPVPFLKENKGYKCNHCTFCSTVERVMGVHTGTVPGHPTARNVTLQHFFHNRLLFAVQPN